MHSIIFFRTLFTYSTCYCYFFSGFVISYACSFHRLKYELLVKCEGVLQKLHDKIEGVSVLKCIFICGNGR